MSSEEEIPFEHDPINENNFETHTSKKRKLNIIMCAVAIIFIIGFSIFLFLNTYESWPEDNSTNYITGVISRKNIYSYRYCKLYDIDTINHTSSISSITIDGKRVKITPNYRLSDDKNKTIIIKFKEKIQNMTHFFRYNDCIRTVDFSNFDTSELIDMSYMFYYDRYLTSINWGSNFSTSKVTNMNNLFAFCYIITTIDLSKFNTSSVIDLSSMFSSCSSLTSLDLSKFDTRNVKYMHYTFSSCDKLKTIYLNNFNTNNVETMYNMFHSCKSIEALDLSSFESSSLKEAFYMFSYCNNLKKIDLRNFKGENLYSSSYIFDNLLGSGTLIYNSSKMNPKVLNSLPSTWNKTDIKDQINKKIK